MIVNRLEIMRFVVVGGFGFCIDGGLLTLLMSQGMDVMPARAISFSLAVSFTWLLNRVWTFSSPERMSSRFEYVLYFSVQVLGALINLSVFFVLMREFPGLKAIPILPFAVASGIAMFFNFFASKFIVFKVR
ncbi:GtrA family protein [Pseudomonas sp. BGr12]|uniref:GtrA family protein n=1 Tax=unclassified Pseudomonas TaxID=196821 RepID=UPI001781C64D|nr:MULTISPECIES: GtrA family protein [unclassified Pseudomonas]MBD9499647.1 GtrA family protein [Pseudomonas sp. PDM17]MDL2426841.1 GtrA family protein [Pseudomonas sp. BJa5]